MGKKDDWCSGKGLKYRAKGMYEKESKIRKILILVLFVVAAIAYFVLGSIHAERSANANKINSEFDQKFTLAMGFSVLTYDLCSVPAYISQEDTAVENFQTSVALECGLDQECYLKGTEWTEAFTYNTVILFV